MCAFATNVARAQDSDQQELKVNLNAADKVAAAQATRVYRHAWPAKTPAGATLKSKETTSHRPARKLAAPNTATNTTAANNDLRFPGDLSYFGGPVVLSAQSHAIYMLPNGNCPIRLCWGSPVGFLNDLAGSDFIHIADEFVGLASSNRYTAGDRFSISYKPTPKTAPLTDDDILGVVHAVAVKTGSGYDHIYHVFLPPGQDECFAPLNPSGMGICYSPDVPENFFFCAYHSSVDFQDIGHVLYTVEPFQAVLGCSVRPGLPMGRIFNSTANALSHELFETITDPDGDAWFNFTAVVLAGEEIGDECAFFEIEPYQGQLQAFFDPSVFKIGTRVWAVQPEYSNAQHACAISP